MTELLVVALATWQAVEIWRHSSLTADWLDAIDFWLDSTDPPVWHDSWLYLPLNLVMRLHFTVRSFLSRLVLCPWCLSVWFGIAIGACHRYGYGFMQLLVFGLAVSRLANLGNDVFRQFCRTPNRLPGDSRADLHS